MMTLLKQASSRRAEKALIDILHKADKDSNGKVLLKDYIEILNKNDITVRKTNVIHVYNYNYNYNLSNEMEPR